MSVLKQVMLGLGIVLSFIGCLQSDVLYANGSVKIYEKRIISSYEIGLGTVPSSPAVGVTHFAIYVKDMDTGYLLDDVDVIFTATDDELGKQISPIEMTNSLMDPNYYELDLNFETEGTWTVRLIVNMESSSHEVNYQVSVRKPNPIIPILTAAVLLLFLVILGLSARAWVREYRKKQ
ncbi:FixH family protein [Dehalococcoidia bacterium]|nr:FixH family protein [Dehalococcoidia bacterium]